MSELRKDEFDGMIEDTPAEQRRDGARAHLSAGHVAASLLVALVIIVVLAVPAVLLGVYDDYVLGVEGPAYLKGFLAVSERTILVLDAVVSATYLINRLWARPRACRS